MRLNKICIKSFILALSFLLTGLSLIGQDESTLYKVSGEGIKDFYLFGTVHIMPQKDFDLKEKVTKALAEADKVVFELDMDDPSLQQKLMGGSALPNGETLEKYLSKEDYTVLATTIKDDLGMDINMLKTFKPFFISTLLIKKYIGENPASFEGALMGLAMESKKEIMGLESVEDQLYIFDAIPYKDQADDIMEMINEEEKIEKLFEDMINKYKNEDITGLYNLFSNYFDNDQEIIDIMVNDRNQKWIPKLKEYAKEDKIFVGVGAGHLGGEKGVVQLLLDEGYTVEAL